MQSLQIFTEGSWNIRTHLVKEVAYFCGKDVAKALGYKKPADAIANTVFEEDRFMLKDIKGSLHTGPLLKNEQGHSVYITEPGVYALIFGSQKQEAKAFKKWVCQDVLPRLRRNYQEQALIALRSENDLHYRVVSAIRRLFPHALLVASCGELQDTPEKRIEAYRKGYTAGTPDIIILNHHKTYNGFAIELKSPQGKGKLSEKQAMCLEQYRKADFKTLVNDDYDSIMLSIFEYFQSVRLCCGICGHKFKTEQTLHRHCTKFHKCC